MNNLKALRDLRGIKQGVLAKELGIRNQASISEWETGRKSLSLENAIMFARFFDVTVGCVAGTEPIPEGYPDHLPPVIYNVETPTPAKVADVETSFRPKKEKIPFTEAQISYLDQREDRLVEKITAALKEDTFLLKETGTRDE